MEKEIATYTFSPQFSDIDSIGIAHHSKYFVWFENARFYFLENILRITKKELIELDIFMPLADASCSFLKRIEFNDALKIKIVLTYSNFAKIVFKYEIFKCNELEELVAIGETKHLFTTSSFELLLKLPKRIKQAIEIAKKKHPLLFISSNQLVKINT